MLIFIKASVNNFKAYEMLKNTSSQDSEALC